MAQVTPVIWGSSGGACLQLPAACSAAVWEQLVLLPLMVTVLAP